MQGLGTRERGEREAFRGIQARKEGRAGTIPHSIRFCSYPGNWEALGIGVGLFL